MTHKSGFVNIIGNPNVGKSTLMNELVGEKLSIITSKAQTTRHRILGIVNTEDYQVVFSDTPGILKPHYKMHEAMMGFVHTAIEDADILLYVTDIYETIDKNQEFIDKINNCTVPVIVVINKLDQCKDGQMEELFEVWKKLTPKAELFAISALIKFNIDNLFNRVVELLPEGEAFYDKESFTDKTERFIVSEVIREKIFLYYTKEVPYSIEVACEEFIEEENIIRIKTVIFVSRESQKGIIIGKGGEAIKKVGSKARADLEVFFGKKIFLEMFVKVEKDWRDNTRLLKQFGYNN